MLSKREIFLILLLLCVAGGGYYVWNNRFVPCRSTLHYSLGAYDERFGVSQSDFLADLQQAAEVWNAALGKEIFIYDPQGKLSVNEVYDKRQQTLEAQQAIEAGIDAKKARQASIANEFAQAGSRERREALQKEYDNLSQEIAADDANLLHSELGEIDIGRYVQDKTGTHIYIYEIESQVQLRHVLAHEFGHALGLEHNENPKSIMYFEVRGDGLSLSPDDKAALAQLCSGA